MSKTAAYSLIKKTKGSILIVAEVSANHGQNFKRAAAMIKEAKKCGADAVKFQAYMPDTLTIDCSSKYFRIKHPKWRGQTLYELYKKAYIPWEWLRKLKKVADDSGILFFATAFDKTSVDFLEELNVRFHKISSFELVDLPLIEYAARTKKPLMISTGMADAGEIREAIAVARKGGAKEIILLKCVSNYPARPEEMNLRAIPHMEKLFGCPIGLSDHSIGIGASICAAALGASVIEKHFTLSRKIKTPDSFFSIEPRELKELVENIRIAEKALGEIEHNLTKEEKKSRVFRRSLFAVKDVKKGEIFSLENVQSIRPAYGLEPKHISKILGRKAKRDIKRGTPLNWGLISS
ncbi:MAG: pseudaminic acid synthase [Sedimentisphaerales bacterium]|nr:pseudaminic acid synthase [Sedimentisphaerales bacterium]